MRRLINLEDEKWFLQHSDWKRQVIDESLKKYGVMYYYEIPKDIMDQHFFGDYILVIEDNKVEDWSAADIKALASLVK